VRKVHVEVVYLVGNRRQYFVSVHALSVEQHVTHNILHHGLENLCAVRHANVIDEFARVLHLAVWHTQNKQ